jgi:hypothetical protein
MALYPEGTAPFPMDDVQRAANKANELGRQALGQNGFWVDNGSNNIITGPFVALQCLSAVEFSILAGTNLQGDGISGNSLPAGTIIYGYFTSFQTTTGLVVAYYA